MTRCGREINGPVGRAVDQAVGRTSAGAVDRVVRLVVHVGIEQVVDGATSGADGATAAEAVGGVVLRASRPGVRQ